MSRKQKPGGNPPAGRREDIVMLDGRVYVTFDSWQTVYVEKDGRRRLVIGRQADLARYLAIAQSTGSASF